MTDEDKFESNKVHKPRKWHATLSGAFTGLLVGNIAGFSSTSIVEIVVTISITLMIAAISAEYKGIKLRDTTGSVILLSSFSTFCLIGMYLGIYINEHRLLSPGVNNIKIYESNDGGKYIKSTELYSMIDALDIKIDNNLIDYKQAYMEIRRHIDERK